MIHNFDTEDRNAALGALLVYGCYRSRDTTKFKVTPDMWGVIERAVKGCAKRSETLHDFIEKFKGKVDCSTLRPDMIMCHTKPVKIMIEDERGGFVTKQETGNRAFWTSLIESSNHEQCIEELYKHTAFIILLVRDRLEREKSIQQLEIKEESDAITLFSREDE